MSSFKKIKRVLSIIILICTVLTLLGGCKKPEPEPTPEPEPGSNILEVDEETTIEFLYDDYDAFIEQFNPTNGDTPTLAAISVLNGFLYYVDYDGATYRINKRDLTTQEETVLYETTQRIIDEFFVINENELFILFKVKFQISYGDEVAAWWDRESGIYKIDNDELAIIEGLDDYPAFIYEDLYILNGTLILNLEDVLFKVENDQAERMAYYWKTEFFINDGVLYYCDKDLKEIGVYDTNIFERVPMIDFIEGSFSKSFVSEDTLGLMRLMSYSEHGVDWYSKIATIDLNGKQIIDTIDIDRPSIVSSDAPRRGHNGYTVLTRDIDVGELGFGSDSYANDVRLECYDINGQYEGYYPMEHPNPVGEFRYVFVGDEVYYLRETNNAGKGEIGFTQITKLELAVSTLQGE